MTIDAVTSHNADQEAGLWAYIVRPLIGTLLIAWAKLSLATEVASMIGAAVNYKLDAADLIYAWRTVGWFISIGWLVLGIKMVGCRKPV